MTVFAFSSDDLDKMLNAYTEEAIAAYPDRETVIKLFDVHVRGLFNSKHVARWVVKAATDTYPDDFEPVPQPPYVRELEERRIQREQGEPQT